MSKSELERSLLFLLKVEGLPEPSCEVTFHPTRRWRFDFAYLERKVAVEVEGGLYTNGRHTRGAGYERDLEKYNEAALRGWTVLRFSKAMIEDGRAIETLKKVLG